MSAEALNLEIEGASLAPEELESFTRKLVAALKSVYDPEIPVDIYELGLIYKVDVADNKNVAVDMTLDRAGLLGSGRNAGNGEIGAGRRRRNRDSDRQHGLRAALDAGENE